MNLAVIALAAASVACAPVSQAKDKPVPPQIPGGTIIVGILPGAQRPDGNYRVLDEQNSTSQSSSFSGADSRYEEMKASLDARFSKMFELKAELDRSQAEVSAKWEEYNVLRQAYERQLKRIIADWVTEMNYTNVK